MLPNSLNENSAELNANLTNPINLENIPTELKPLKQWVCWKKEDKCPVNPKSGRNASSDKPTTWGAVDQAFSRFESQKGGKLGGIGFVFSENDPFVGIDADHCRDKETGEINQAVKDELLKLGTYCEISPSGTGIHAIVKGKLPGDGLGPKKGRLFEMYDKGRYFTFTGQWLGEFGGDIQDRQEEVLSLYKRMAGGNGPDTTKTPVSSILAGVPENTRNISCASVAGKFFYEGHDNEEVLEMCLEWNRKNSPPLDEKEIIKTVASISRKHARRQAEIEEMMVSSGLDHRKVIDALYSNEDGDARLFQALYRDKFIYDHGGAQWAQWTGHYWKDDETEQAYKAIETVIDLYRGALAVEKKKEKKLQLEIKTTIRAWDNEQIAADQDACLETQKQLTGRIKNLESAARKRNVLWLAGIGTGLTGREWDKNPWLLACKNGVLDLSRGVLRPGKQTDYIKTATDIIYDPNAKCPTWDSFLEQIFDYQEDVIDYVRRLFGYGITGLKEEHIIPILWGAGRNGKGTFLETLKCVLGDFAHKTRAETLLDSGKTHVSGSADADTMAFRGKRLIWASETNEGGRLNVGKLKELCGGDTLNARAPYGRRSIEFEPTHLLCLITNAKPYAPPSDYALWERIHLIPFTLSFVDKPQRENERPVDKELPSKLKEELPGILGWLVRGCAEWDIFGLGKPKTVKAATADYQKENDLIGDFISENCVIKEEAEVKAGTLYGQYENWCKEMGHKPQNGKRFAQEILKSFNKELRRNRSFYIGIGLNDDNKESKDFDVFDTSIEF